MFIIKKNIIFAKNNLFYMIKRIYQISDLHIPNSEEDRPYEKMQNIFLHCLVDDIIHSGYNSDEIRIVLVGDIFHQKIKVSNEARVLFHKLLNTLSVMAKTIIVAGNHDLLENNKSRTDSIGPTFEIANAYDDKIVYIDKDLGYESGCLIDDNIVWVLYSIFDNYKKPFIEKKEDKQYIGLYHGSVVGAVTDSGRMSEEGVDTNIFTECNCVMAGHIHKFQEIRKNGVPIVYSSSLYQRDCGENISMHGYVVWDIPSMTYNFVEVPNNYRYYKFLIESYDDVKEDKERLINL